MVHGTNGQSGRETALRWAAGVAATALFSGVGFVVTEARSFDQQMVTLQRDLVDLKERVEHIAEDVSTNRLTRMAPETRVELDAIRRELDAAWRRIQMLEGKNH